MRLAHFEAGSDSLQVARRGIWHDQRILLFYLEEFLTLMALLMGLQACKTMCEKRLLFFVGQKKNSNNCNFSRNKVYVPLYAIVRSRAACL